MKFDSSTATVQRRTAVIAPLIAGGLFLGGCMSSPTYGTDKSANEQLLSDVSKIVSIAPERKSQIDYKPRPDLVRPASTQQLALPPPQENVATASNPNWVESPEQKQGRLYAEISDKENSGDAMSRQGESGVRQAYDSPIVADDDMAPESNSYLKDVETHNRRGDSGVRPDAERETQREEVKKRIVETKQGSATQRKYLSEPPLTYREAAASAPQDEVGDDEWKKERAAKRAARKKGSGSWTDWIPGL